MKHKNEWNIYARDIPKVHCKYFERYEFVKKIQKNKKTL